MTRAPRKAYIVSHTHWDREWYLTYHQFRVHLTETLRLVLDALDRDDDFRHFLLDGQTIVLEDHLEVYPEDRERIARHVRAGRLSIGPWYILPDEFLVSAEATVRNLLIGDKVAGAFGGAQKVGYLPDSFGHIAQMPQILRRAGIDSFVYMRGNGDEIDELGSEYRWRAPDGSEVIAVNQEGGYYNAAALGHEELWHGLTRREVDSRLAVERVGDLFERLSEASNGDVFLLSNGSDHQPPQRDFGRVLAALREAFPETEFVHGSLGAYIDEVRAGAFAKSVYEGELRSGKRYHILSGVWSARMYLKQMNEYAESLLAGSVEPLAAYGRFCHGREYPGGLIEDAWKLLLKNHPHDSICGCSTDEVHREMVPRFAGAIETGERLIRNALDALAPIFGRKAEDDRDTVICVGNPLPVERTEVVERLVVVTPPAPDVESLRLIDESGAPVPFAIIDARSVRRFWGVDYRMELFAERQRDRFETYLREFGDAMLADPSEGDTFLRIQFLAQDLPPVGHALYRLVGTPGPGRSAADLADPVHVRGNTIENGRLRVVLNPNGTFDVLDLSTGRSFRGLNRLRDEEDVGDEYDHSPCPRPLAVVSDGCAGEVRILEDTGFRGRLAVAFALRLPAAIAHERSRRSEEHVACPLTIAVGLSAGSPLIEIELDFDNRARDHRLRAEFPSGVVTDTILSDGHFLVNRRAIAREDHPDWVQPPAGTCPQQGFSLVEDGEAGLAVLNRGLPEIEARLDRGGRAVLSLTLLRAVGWLSRDDFPTRKFGNAGPTLFTPEAQCLGRQVFRYAVVPYEGDFLSAGVRGISERYRTPVPSVQGVWDGHAPGGPGLVRKTSHLTSVSAIKRHEARDTLVVRLWNLAPEPIVETLVFGRVVRGAWRTDLMEERLGEIAAGDAWPRTEISLELKPHEIVTLEIDLEA
jgi:mannosylglycerate hydrolase